MSLRLTLPISLLVTSALLTAGGCSNSDPAKAVATARGHVAAGDRRQAIFELREFVRKHPNSADVRVLLARLQLDQGDVAAAKVALQGLDPQSANQPEAVLDEVRIGLAEGRLQDALLQLDTHGAALDRSVAAVERARILFALVRRPEALDVLERARMEQPDSLPVVTELAVQTAAGGDLEAAYRMLEQASAREANPDALATLGSFDVRLGRSADARREFEQALALPAGDWPSTRRWMVQLALADVDLAQHDLVATKAILEALKRELPAAIAVRFLDARVAMLERRPRDVVRLLAPLADDPKADPRVTLLYTSALVDAGQPEQARLIVGALQNRVATNSTADGWRVLGAAQAALHDLAAASTSMDEAYRLAPSGRAAADAFRARLLASLPDPELILVDWLRRTPNDASVHSMLGLFYQNRGRLADASQEFELAVKDDPRNFAARNNLATILASTDPARAETLARAAQVLAPQDPAIDDTLGWILIQRKNVPEGLPLVAAAARRMPANASVQYHYAVGLAHSGREREARMILETILLSRREFEERAEATRLLDTLSISPRTTQDG